MEELWAQGSGEWVMKTLDCDVSGSVGLCL